MGVAFRPKSRTRRHKKKLKFDAVLIFPFCMLCYVMLIFATFICYFIFWLVFSGDPSIVYIDGVTPPTSRNLLNLNQDQNSPESQRSTEALSSSGGTAAPDVATRPLQQRSSVGKGPGLNQLRLLQTIREDETESR